MGQILIKDPKGIPLYQLGAEVIKRKDKIIFKTLFLNGYSIQTNGPFLPEKF